MVALTDRVQKNSLNFIHQNLQNKCYSLNGTIKSMEEKIHSKSTELSTSVDRLGVKFKMSVINS